MEFIHKSVLLDEVINGLNIKSDGTYVDATLGGAGHSYHILSRLKSGHLYGFDQDAAAIETSRTRLQTLSLKNFTLFHKNFKFIKEELNKINVTKVDGILFDLGVSSFQFDNKERGFSYRFDSRLDMRMDQRNELSAYEVINKYKEEDLARIIYYYGEERFSRSIARHIVEARKIKHIETTFELVDIIKASIPKRFQVNGHPAKKTFQAIRIEVNQELEILESSLKDAISLLNKGGRICVISFHSLEDRIVKDVFKSYCSEGHVNRFMPISEKNKQHEYKLITNKPITASESELESNNRAHSAKLRILEKL